MKRAALIFPLCLLLFGCATPQETAGLITGVTALGARSPSQEIEQIYYLGVFDPRDQIPPSVYRVTVHGQASILGLTRFASGWVPAEAVDSLTRDISFNKKGKIVSEGDTNSVSLQVGRKLVVFGPEGFRESPRNHRLVLLMSSNPEEYFKAVQRVTGKLNAAYAEEEKCEDGSAALRSGLQGEAKLLKELEKDLDAIKLPASK